MSGPQGCPIDPKERVWYMMDARSPVGNCAMWWGPKGVGYVCNLEEAGLYTLEEALGHRPTDVPVHVSVARSCVVSHVRWEALERAGIGFRDDREGGAYRASLEAHTREKKASS